MTRIVAFIPARGGSERIPRKNLAMVEGLTLLQHAYGAALGAGIREIVVSTDDVEIAERVARARCSHFTLDVHERPALLAGPSAQIESAIEHWWRSLDARSRPDVVVLLQPTSPLRDSSDIRACLDLLQRGAYDAVWTVTESHAHHFAGRLRAHGNGDPMWIRDWPIDAAQRPRSQDLPRRAHENGAVYAFTRAHWERTRNRLAEYSRASQVLMPWWRSIEIDTAEDLEVVRAIAGWRAA